MASPRVAATARRPRHRKHGYRTVRTLPPGLLNEERQWIEARAAQVGGLTAAFRHLVRLAILHDAVTATLAGARRLTRRARHAGRSRRAIDRRVQTWGVPRASWRLGGRFLNLMTWRRLGMPDAYGDAPEDDPAEPLPRTVVRCLITEGSPVFTK